MEKTLLDLCLDFLLKHIHQCPNTTGLVIQKFVDSRKLTDEILDRVVSSGTTSMKISNVWMSLSDKSMELLGNRCPHLVSVHLQHCAKISDLGLTTLVKGCRNISSLTLECCWRIGDEGIRNSFQYLTQLAEFTLDNNSLVTTIPWQYASSLKLLRIQGCKITPGSGFQSLLEHGCPSLRKLVMPTMVTEPDHCLISYLTEGCPNLEELYFWRVPLLPSSSISAISRLLQYVSSVFSKCLQLTQSQASLKAVNLQPHVLGLVPLQIMAAVFQNCRQLEAIAVGYRSEDTRVDEYKEALEAIAKHAASNLKVLCFPNRTYSTAETQELEPYYERALSACLRNSRDSLIGLGLMLSKSSDDSNKEVLQAMRDLPNLRMLIIKASSYKFTDYVKDSALSLHYLITGGFLRTLSDEDAKLITSTCPNMVACYDGYQSTPPWVDLKHPPPGLTQTNFFKATSMFYTLHEFGYE